MIQYTLKCTQGHQFDSWFQSSAAFDKLAKAGHVSCAICGSTQVEKALMAPRVGVKENTKEATAAPDQQAAQPSDPQSPPPAPARLNAPSTEAEKALAAMKEHVEKNSDYVGDNFAAEARAIHDGDAPERPIWGEAKPKEAKELIEDGIPVAPLPFTPTRKTN
ncbi:MAG: DUF1178 family protein [Pelagimonas sp.]|jgi:hypothetical protein|nr:DUF1178 family protein [Pelagimonas sp.]